MRSFFFALVPLLALAASGSALAAAGKVTFLEGSATRTPKDGPAVAVADGAELLDGDTLETAAGGRLELTLEDGSVARLDEKSKLVVDSVSKLSEESWAVKLTLTLGQIWSKVTRKVGEGAGYEVQTERAVAGVRGTEFLVEAAGEHTIEVYEGAVEVGVRGEQGEIVARHRVALGQHLRIDAARKTGGPGQGHADRAFRKWAAARQEKAALKGEKKDKHEKRRERRYDRLEQRRESRPR